VDVLVSGSTGLVGSALCASLERDGHRVRRLRRGGAAGDDVAWDPERGEIDAAGVEGVDAAVHLAGVSIGEHRWTGAQKRAIRESRVLGTDLLARALAACSRPPGVLVSASAVGYYGKDRGDEVLAEDAAPGDDFLARLCVDWEAATAPAADAGIRVACVRSGVVLSRDGGTLPRMVLPFRLGVGGRQGPGTQYLSWISIDDEVAAIRRVVDDDALAGPVNLTAPEPVTNAALARTLGRVLHRPAVLPTPMLALRLVYGRELVDTVLLGGQRVVPAKLLAAGHGFRHPDLETALRACVG
jgi:uncharacterized protein (TIGR01777 family)